MKILEKCSKLNDLSNSILDCVANINKESILQNQFLGELMKQLQDIEKLFEDLETLGISSEMFRPVSVYTKEELKKAAQELIKTFYMCISDNSDNTVCIFSIAFLENIFANNFKANELFIFMEKYVKAASVLLSPQIESEDKKFLYYAFEVEYQEFDLIAERMEVYRTVLFEKYRCFIRATVYYSETEKDKKTVMEVHRDDSSIMPVEVETSPAVENKKDVSDANLLSEYMRILGGEALFEENVESGCEEEIISHEEEGKEKEEEEEKGEEEEKRKEEGEKEKGEGEKEEKREEEREKEKEEEGEKREEEREKVREEEEREKEEGEEEKEEKEKEEEREKEEEEEEKEEKEKEEGEEGEEEREKEEKEKEEEEREKEEGEEEKEEEGEEEKEEKEREERGIENISEIEEDIHESTTPLLENLRETAKTESFVQESKSALLKSEKESNDKRKKVLEKERDLAENYSNSVYEKYIRLTEVCIKAIENGEILEESMHRELSQMCWDLLFYGQPVLAREFAQVFQVILEGECVDPALIALVGSGFYQPITDEDTGTQVLCYQSHLQWDKLDVRERMAAVWAIIPAMHCNVNISLNEEMINILPECFQVWMKQVQEEKRNVSYIDVSAIENYRKYQLRLKKLKAIQDREKKLLESMLNPKLRYELGNKVLVAICGKGQHIGELHDMIIQIPLEEQAYGIKEQGVKVLCREAEKYLPERKNNSRGKNENLIGAIIEDGRKEYGYNNKILGETKAKMYQIIGEYLEMAYEWLELIRSSCSYNPYDDSTQFMDKLVQVYLGKRHDLCSYIDTMKDNKILRLVGQRCIIIMDYLAGEEDKDPDGWKTELQHAYRLCAVPSLKIKKNEIGAYQYECQNTQEHLEFLNEVLKHELKTVEECIDDFIEADAFSGCHMLFDLLPPEKKENVKVHFDKKVAERLSELAKEVSRLRKDLYQVSVYVGSFEREYQFALSEITQIEYMLEKPDDVSVICEYVKECSLNVQSLVDRFRIILRNQVEQQKSNHVDEMWSRRLERMIDEGQYSAVIEWMAHMDNEISDSGTKAEDFFSNRFFAAYIYTQKEKSLLDSNMRIRELTEKLQSTVQKANSWGGFNFNKVPGGLGNARAKLLEYWYKIKTRLQSMKISPIMENDLVYGHLKEMLESLGWNNVTLENKGLYEDESGSHIQFDMHFVATHSRDICPIPLFGSNSGGRIRIRCLYGSVHAPDKLHYLFEGDNERIPTIILFFGVMTRKRRIELYNLMLEKEDSFLVIDDIVITTICERRESMLLKWMFTLTVPFSVQTMYTSSLGVVHPEMFYGRISAKKNLGIGGSVCAVYGGRQLGKTALLKNIEFESHQPQDDHYVYYIKLPTREIEETEQLLTRAIGKEVRKDIEQLDKPYSDIEMLLDDIREWLEEKQTRRLLILLDEADQFLLSDSKKGFHVTGIINGLMTAMDLRFKVVFAGLHNVYRMISVPNHPLAHHGRPISIGPLLDEELQDAINLISQPFKIMGYRFESLDLIVRMLAETNYYPSLIQLLCMKLHDYLLLPEIRRNRSGDLPVVIRMKDIDAVLESQELKKSISDRFMWTLELDNRYKAIALSIAFAAQYAVQESASRDIVQGYDLNWICREVDKWPGLFEGHSSQDNIRGLCDELVQLGILRNIQEDRYTLRTINILNMLGTPDNIFAQMEELNDKRYDYSTMFDAMLYRNIFSEKEIIKKCYPLTNQQIRSILGVGGLKILVGSSPLEIDQVEPCLRELMAMQDDNSVIGDSYGQKAYKLKVYNKTLPGLEELGDGLTVNLISAENSWEMQDLEKYKEELERIDENNRPVLLFLCDAKKSHWMQIETSVNCDSIPTIRLSTWDMEAVQFWLSELGVVPVLAEDITKIMERLCGWPRAMYEFGRLLTERENELISIDDVLEKTVGNLVEKEMLSEMLFKEMNESWIHWILFASTKMGGAVDCEDVLIYLVENEAIQECNEQEDLQRIEKVMNWMADMKLLNRVALRTEKKLDMYTVNNLIKELWGRTCGFREEC